MSGTAPLPRGVLYRWASVLPLTERTPRITLGEGDTPLVRSATLERECGLDELWFKLESCNPTGSFKDRGMVVAVAKAMESGARAIMCASTGNTSASAAAYAAKCGLECFVLVPGGKETALGGAVLGLLMAQLLGHVLAHFLKRLDLRRGDTVQTDDVEP